MIFDLSYPLINQLKNSTTAETKEFHYLFY
jgi:hypothetical protein